MDGAILDRLLRGCVGLALSVALLMAAYWLTYWHGLSDHLDEQTEGQWKKFQVPSVLIATGAGLILLVCVALSLT